MRLRQIGHGSAAATGLILTVLSTWASGVVIGCAHQSARIGPNEWDDATTRVYAVPRGRAFSAVWKYLGSVGTVTRAERETGRIEARVGKAPADVRAAVTARTGLPVYQCAVSPQGQDSSRVALRIVDARSRKKHYGSGVVVDSLRLPYKAALDSIGLFIRRANAAGM